MIPSAKDLEESMERIKVLAQKINNMAEFEKWPIGMSVTSGLVFAGGIAGLNGVVSREDFLEMAAYTFDIAQEQRKKAAN